LMRMAVAAPPGQGRLKEAQMAPPGSVPLALGVKASLEAVKPPTA